MQAYITGIGTGLVVANVQMWIETEKRLFCQPGKLGLEKDNFIRILDDEIKKLEQTVGFETAQDIFAESVLLGGLKTTFPCK